jgi:hypothetical protein
MSKGVVLQDWVGDLLTWKQQSTMFSALRGPDNLRCDNVKKVTRWLRGVTQKDADPSDDYMRKMELPSIEELNKELEFTSVHYFCHLMHVLEIIDYKHPEQGVRRTASDYYLGIVHALHLNQETFGQLEIRLKDKT